MVHFPLSICLLFPKVWREYFVVHGEDDDHGHAAGDHRSDDALEGVTQGRVGDQRVSDGIPHAGEQVHHQEHRDGSDTVGGDLDTQRAVALEGYVALKGEVDALAETDGDQVGQGEGQATADDAVQKLEKWRGNLYNWYDLTRLAVISGFVSSVDSGNFLACLIAVKECLVINNISPSLAARIEKIISETDLGAFYCKKKKLFSIGYDSEKGELSPHRYDMLMSEARILSYTAIALGQVPKSHWRALSRTMSRCGSYAGAIAWTGTMFEFYMPELLLTSKEGSMSYEALRYSFYCQKRRHRPFGISESGYYAFDRDLNYQYKAHGVQKTALKGGMDRECVISPYSSYLAMSLHPLESWNNLALLEREGAFDPEFGFYEAVDYTKGRVGDKAVIKSFMAHHTGMSICGAANALCNNICARLFLNDERMKRAEELLEEKVMSGEKVLKITEEHYDDGKVLCEREETVDQQAENSPVNVLWSGRLALFTSANG